jgi:hypothetical protein
LKGRLAAIVTIAAVCWLSLHPRAAAQTLLERLIMPGPLVEGHAKLEARCTNCHEPFSRHSQTKLCLDCHKETAADRATHKGLHGLERAASTEPCIHCHTDHKGRGADISQLDRETFDHDLTNFKLVDAHRSVPCDGCHTENAKFRKTPSTCVECHKKVEPHQGRLGQRCDSCHTMVKWHETKPFDHGKTRFPLQGAHEDVRCAMCHSGELYKDLPSSCVSCHRLQDVHADRYGAKCETCHDATKWKAVHFDHDKTKYPLRGAHAKVRCDSCHVGDLYRQKLATTCISCHRKEDPHQGKLGERCDRCHDENDWRKKLTFDHDLTRMPLIGLHASVPCEECHRSLAYKDAPLACEKCHQDRHQGRLGTACGSCHNPNGWERWRFDHSKQTSYPLTGAHRDLVCEACHQVKSPPSLKLATDCFSCHGRSDPHSGNFGRGCERCHVTADWKKLSIKN